MGSRKKADRMGEGEGPEVRRAEAPGDPTEGESVAEPTTPDSADVPEPEANELLLAEEVIAQLQGQFSELEDRYVRLAAEFDNFRKRTLRERAQQTDRAQAELVRQLLESLDDLTRVSELGSSDHGAAAILQGVQLVELKLRRALESFGLKQIEAVGQPFNPELHDAMITVPTEHPEEDEVVSQELAKGYLFKEVLLRPSLVEVKKYDSQIGGGGGNDGPDATEDGS